MTITQVFWVGTYLHSTGTHNRDLLKSPVAVRMVTYSILVPHRKLRWPKLVGRGFESHLLKFEHPCIVVKI